MDHPKAELKFVAARALDGTAAALDGADVADPNGEKLGVVEGFIVDARQNRPRHVVVAAGWFHHKHFLLPIGHVTLSPDRTKITADIAKERVAGFPGFDKSDFQILAGEVFSHLDKMMAAIAAGSNVTDFDAHYRIPEWWEDTESER